jgi:ferritin-like protein
MCAEPYHEPLDLIPEEARDYHRAIVSMIEELQAIDWYHQRISASSDPELKGILAHNRDEEKEHASMLLEWLRRRDSAFSRELKDYLFTEGEILELEKEG